jgi:hypothetical protein
MGAVNTTYTFTATDTITSTKMNDIIDETVMTGDACLSGGGLQVASGQLSIAPNAINSSRLASNSVTSANIVDGTIVNADINASAAIDGTKISPSFGTQNIRQDGNSLRLLQYNGSSSLITDIGIGAITGNNNDLGVGNFSSSGSLVLGTNNTERMRITASGNVGIGTGSPQTKLQVAGGTVRIEAHAGEGGQLELLNAANNDVQAVFDVDPNDLTRLWTLPYEPLSLGTAGGEKMRIAPDGNVGIGTTTPSTKLQVNGTVTATAFSGPLTGNVTGDVTGNVTGSSGSSGSCTGNSATATLATKASTLSNGGGNGNAMTFHYSSQVGTPAYVWGSNDASGGNNNYVWSPATFSVNYANSSGSATTASTVSNSAITAAKLDGNQSGSAPIFGVRAWVNFDATRDSSGATNALTTNRFIRSSGNVTSVKKDVNGKFFVTFTTAFANTNYTVVCSAGDSDEPRLASADRATATVSGIQIETDNLSGNAANFAENNVIVIG